MRFISGGPIALCAALLLACVTPNRPVSGSRNSDGGLDAAEPNPDLAGSDSAATTDVAAGGRGALANGAPCMSGTECASGSCFDGVCCDRPCSGQCEACAESTTLGKCTAIVGAPRSQRVACAGQGSVCAGRCDGTNGSTCTYPAADRECAAPSCMSGTALTRSVCDGKGGCPAPALISCAPFTCDGTMCAGGCSQQRPCATASYCSSGRCLPKKDQGSNCTMNDECQGDRCVDGVCCDQVCTSSCMACNLQGSIGKCTAVPSGPPQGMRPACGSGSCAGTCAGRPDGQCSFPTGACGGGPTCAGTSIVQSVCVSGACVAGAPVACPSRNICVGGGCLSVKQLSAGDRHSCVLLSDDSVRCWGANDVGQLGRDTRTLPSGEPRPVAGLTAPTRISVGSHSTCALAADGSPLCWGFHQILQHTMQTFVPFSTPGISGATDLELGYVYRCALFPGGSIKCWGPYEPAAVNDVAGAKAIAIDAFLDACALLSDGSLKCWTRQTRDQNAVTLGGISGATSVVAGSNHFCALIEGGGVKCWGKNQLGQLGNGTTIDSTLPVAMNLSGVAMISAEGDYSCALLSGGAVMCWGSSDVPVIGGGPRSFSSTPVSITGLSDAAALAVGAFHACTLSSAGVVKCWGDNRWGQLGQPTMVTASSTPLTITGW